jgi:enoyl-CoA hydratase/carnithine racemase
MPMRESEPVRDGDRNGAAVRLDDYAGRFGCARLTRTDGVLEVALHTDGGPLVWAAGPHRELPELFAAIAADQDNRVVILTGTGDSFCRRADASIMEVVEQPGGWERITREGTAILTNLLGIGVPMIAAVNGPASVHAELAVLCDIVLAADTVYFADRVHLVLGTVPGDGVQVIWPLLLGPNRGRHFLLTGARIPAEEALRLGVVAEVLPADRLLDRARELAADLARHPALTLRHTRELLTEPLRAELDNRLARGFQLEGDAMQAPIR